MSTSRQAAPRFVVCVDNTGYPASLELHKIYRVVPDEEAEADGDIRVVDESGEDYLYSQGLNRTLMESRGFSTARNPASNSASGR
jgi:hypothetical protein